MASEDYKEVIHRTNPNESVFNQPKPKVFLTDLLMSKIVNAAKPYPIPEGQKYEYGTAGVWTDQIPLIIPRADHATPQFRMKA